MEIKNKNDTTPKMGPKMKPENVHQNEPRKWAPKMSPENGTQNEPRNYSESILNFQNVQIYV